MPRALSTMGPTARALPLPGTGARGQKLLLSVSVVGVVRGVAKDVTLLELPTLETRAGCESSLPLQRRGRGADTPRR